MRHGKRGDGRDQPAPDLTGLYDNLTGPTLCWIRDETEQEENPRAENKEVNQRLPKELMGAMSHGRQTRAIEGIHDPELSGLPDWD